MVQKISPEIEITMKSLKANHFDVRFASKATEARAMMLEMIPLTASIGVGDSVTLRQIGVLEELSRRKNRVVNPFTRELTRDIATRDLFTQTSRNTFGADVFITGANAVTQDGKIVSVDYAGNRVAGSIFGGNKVILAIGRNKIVRDVEEAIHRIKNVIAPFHAKWKGRKTPCTVTGKCSDCDSPDRICNVTVILEKKLGHTDLSVVLIDEDLGLGWDPAWSEQRICDIKSSYGKNTWAFFPKE